MAGPDIPVPRDDGILRARIEARNADPLEMEVSIKLVTTEATSPYTEETYHTTFPVIEVSGFNRYDQYRFGTPGTSWSETDVVAEESLANVDFSDVCTDDPEE